MSKRFLIVTLTIAVAALTVSTLLYGSRNAQAFNGQPVESANEGTYSEPVAEPVVAENGFSVEVLIDGRPLAEYAARGRRYVEALENAEYELRIHNPSSARIAVALSVDGLNTIDARHTSAWEAHKWVIQPYGTIYVRGWQMSSENARRFYFTTERDSYAAKLGQAANLGVISAVFFRERGPFVIQPVTPAPPRPIYKDEDRMREERAPSPKASTESGNPSGLGGDMAKRPSAQPYPPPDDESAATGIGRTVRNDVQWIRMDLESHPAAEVMIRYEYRAALVRLGIIPRDYNPRPEVLNRRERAKGFEPGYCPQP